MSYYPNDFIEQVRFANDIVSLISEDTVLKGRGERFMGLCPFPEHSEKTPSFSVSQSKQLYHCFGCQNSGNIFTYLQKQKGMNFVEAVEYLARKEGIPIPKIHNVKQKAFQPKLLELNEKICQFYENQLKQAVNQTFIQNYLKKRAWTKETVKHFRLGYAPKNNKLLSILKPEEIKLAMELGLIQSSRDARHYDNFRHRLIFPIISHRKQVVGFGARVLDDSHPKYINSKESQIFHKGKIFYGLNESARYLRQQSFALIVEGYTDFLALWQAGFKNLTATLGTALTADHARLLKRYVDSVILVFDGDEAGLQASERSLPILLNESLTVKFLPLPEGQDPDDFIRSKGQKAFQSQLENSKDLFFFILQKKYAELKKQNRDSWHLIDEMSPLLSSVQSESLQTIYKQRLMGLFGDDARLLEKTLNKKIQSLKKKSPATPTASIQPEPPQVFSLASALKSERLILVLCLESEDFLKRFFEISGISLLKTQGIIKIFEKIKKEYEPDKSIFDKLIHLIVNEIADPHLIFKASYPIFNSVGLESQKQIFQDCINFLQKKQKSSEASVLLTEMKINPKEELHNLEKVFQLTKQRLKQGEKPKI